MMTTVVRTCLVAVCCAATTPLASQELGSITFPTSGAPAAQAAFLDGVKSLHSFQFDEAAVAFQRAQKTGASNTRTFIAGYSAAKMGDFATADAAEKILRQAREQLAAGANPYSARPVAIMEKQIGALSRSARGQKDEAIRLAREAMEIELTLSAPSGPPDPIKPAPEFYGELLLAAGRNAEAAAALELSLQRTPNRTASVKALARAKGTGTALH